MLQDAKLMWLNAEATSQEKSYMSLMLCEGYGKMLKSQAKVDLKMARVPLDSVGNCLNEMSRMGSDESRQTTGIK